MIQSVVFVCALAIAPDAAASPEAASSLDAPVASPRLVLSAQVEETLSSLPEARAAAVRARLSGLQAEPRPAGAVEVEGGLLELELFDLGLWIAYRPGQASLVVEEIGILDTLLGEPEAVEAPEAEAVGGVAVEAPVETETESSASTRFGWRPPAGTGERPRLQEPLKAPVERYWKTTLLVDLISVPLGMVLFAVPLTHWLVFHRPGAALGSLALRWACSAAGAGIGGALVGGYLGPVLIGLVSGLVVAMVLDWIFLSRYPRRTKVSGGIRGGYAALP